LGIRSALGATPNNLALRVLGAGLGRTLLGLALGGLFCAAASRFLESQLYGVKASDPAAALLACAGLCLLTLLGLLIPALRAARLDPARALKED
jgi:ABC-type antimicrobial peptide transport system permease subunit